MVDAADLSLQRLNLGRRSASSSSLGSLDMGNMATALAEEVLRSNRSADFNVELATSYARS